MISIFNLEEYRIVACTNATCRNLILLYTVILIEVVFFNLLFGLYISYASRIKIIIPRNIFAAFQR